MASGPYLHCIYAEDVRPEASGQISIIGVFQGGLSVQAVPAQLAKLTVIADLFLPRSPQPPQRIKLDVMRDREVIQSIEPPAEFVLSAFGQVGNEPDSDGVSMQFMLGFAGFPVTEACKLQVLAYVDDQVMAGNSLKIVVGGTRTGQ